MGKLLFKENAIAIRGLEISWVIMSKYGQFHKEKKKATSLISVFNDV